MAEYERTLIAERMRRGRQAKRRSGQLLPWPRPPYGYLVDPDRPRAPDGVRVDAVQAAVVPQMFAWDSAPRSPISFYEGAKRLSEAQIPTPTGKQRWTVASVRHILRSPSYPGPAYRGRTRPAPARWRQAAVQPIGSGQSIQSPPPEEWIAVSVPAIVTLETCTTVHMHLDRNVWMARRNNKTHEYVRRGLVSGAQCRLPGAGRNRGADAH